MSNALFPHQNDLGTTSSPAEIVYRKCGVIDEYHHAPGKGPHHASLVCTTCGHFIKWLAQPRLPLQPTEKQIAYLRALGHRGELPPTRKLASEQIDALLKGVHHV